MKVLIYLIVIANQTLFLDSQFTVFFCIKKVLESGSSVLSRSLHNIGSMLIQCHFVESTLVKRYMPAVVLHC